MDRQRQRKPKVTGNGFLSRVVFDPLRFHVHLFDSYVEGHIDLPPASIQSLLKMALRLVKEMRLLPLYCHTLNHYSTFLKNNANPAEDIQHHYDLRLPAAGGKLNPHSFFKLLLGPSMAYSMAYWPEGTQTLEQAQQNKFKLYQELLDLRPSHEVYEPGFGFGSFIPYVLEKTPHWQGANLSEYHCRWVQEHYPKLEVRYQDFLLPWTGKNKKFDRIVNIANLESVQRMGQCFENFHAQLKPNGKMLVHLITLPYSGVDALADPWMSSRVFPNGQIYSHEAMIKYAAPYFDVEFEHIYPGIHYAKTLQVWLKNFGENYTKIEKLGAPPEFMRFWYLYLIVCEALFAAGFLQNSLFIFVPKSRSKKILLKKENS